MIVDEPLKSRMNAGSVLVSPQPLLGKCKSLEGMVQLGVKCSRMNRCQFIEDFHRPRCLFNGFLHPVLRGQRSG